MIEGYGGGKSIYDFNVTIAGKEVEMREVLGVKEVEEEVQVERTFEEEVEGEMISRVVKVSAWLSTLCGNHF